VKKLILLLVVSFLFLTPFVYSQMPYIGIGLDYDYFSKQNQVMVSVFKPEWFPIGGNDMTFYKISLGLRSIIDRNPRFVYKIFAMKGDWYKPIIREDGVRPLNPGGFDYAFWNYYFGASLLNFDNSLIENLFIQWINFSAGLGINLYDDSYDTKKSKDYNIEAALAPKLGLSTFCFGDDNFSNFNNNKKNYLALESGLKFMFGFSFKRDIFIKTNQDYTFFVTEQMINKLTSGVSIDYFYYIPIHECKGCYRDYLKFSIGVSYNKYYFENNYKEFVKFDFGFKYLINKFIIKSFI
jgi:hypothetical protein